jgi:DNA modification methylase
MSDMKVDDCRILHGDALDRLGDVDDNSVHTCVTSPPYWGLRERPQTIPPFAAVQAGKCAAKRYTSKVHEYCLVFRKGGGRP